MTAQAQKSGSRRSLATSIALVVALVVAAIVLRRPLVAWFTGASMGAGEGRPVTVVAGPFSTVGSPGLSVGNSGSASAPGGMGSGAVASSPGEIDHYTCSMHPSVKQKTPGTCPICGMHLIPVTKEQHEQGVVMIDEARRQLIGVRTAPVVEAPMRSVFRAVGQVAYDEAALSDVNLKVHGWITKLYVNETGQRVSKGQTLFTMYSPELYNAEQDFLLGAQGAAASASADDSVPRRTQLLAQASRQRLHLLGLTDAQVDAIAKNGKPSEDLAIPSPASGFVIEKNVVEGASVDAGMRLYRIAALNRVWVEADVYEADLSHVRMGQSAHVMLDYLPGRPYDARVAYVYPYLDPKSRTGRVRIELANKNLDLRPGMYANVELAADVGSRVQVPAAAVVYTGPRRLVFIDLGQGRFKPQEIQVGTEANGMYEVLAGLKPGDLVATSGVFLIAAEARISTAAKYWESNAESDAAGAAPARETDTPSPAAYSCPMHPEVKSATPGKCPKCGMNLEPMGGKP
jgi:Cu(I)/Ag(I) efflux system membrane fusion protein